MAKSGKRSPATRTPKARAAKLTKAAKSKAKSLDAQGMSKASWSKFTANSGYKYAAKAYKSEAGKKFRQASGIRKTLKGPRKLKKK